jgi:predicted dehydrogenase
MGKLGVGVLGAHRWADKAHLPGYAAYDRVNLVAICDVVQERAREMADKYGIPNVFTNPDDLIGHPDVDMVDVCTPTDTHFDLSMRAIAAKKHVLSEKPLARDAADAFRAAKAAEEQGVRTKLGFTFRYSPALRMVQDWIKDGTLGEIFHVHGLEQNSQFLDPTFPLRQVPVDVDASRMIPSSIVGYGSHLVDLMRWCAGDFSAVVSSMNTYVTERLVRGYEGMVRLPIDDGTVALVEFESRAQGILQTSYVAIGNYPGIEIRIYGSKGAVIARLVEEFGVAETLKFATPEDVEWPIQG